MTASPGHDVAAANSAVLDALFPEGVATVLSLAPDAAEPLSPVEAAFTTSFAPVRLAEFRHGRACARRALLRLGATPSDIPVGAHREPIWPAGIVGSISHAGAAAAAVVARATALRSVGLDIERAGALEPGLAARICTAEELRRYATGGASPGEAEMLVFVLKEAAYKALWPCIGRFLDFHDLEVTLDRARGAFTVASRSAACPAPLAAALEGRFARHGELLAAGVALRADEP